MTLTDESIDTSFLQACSQRLGVTFNDTALLRQALCHRSWCAEHPGTESNERLEFLGDSVLGIVITDFIFREYPQFSEGELAKLRQSVVSATTLSDVASELGLGEFVLLGKGEDQAGGREKPSILADCFEAVIGAIYLDSGLDAATDFLLRLFSEPVREGSLVPGGQDFKTRLQEYVARERATSPRYEITDEGPDHAKVFTASVFVADEQWGSGSGRSKRQAEQEAARSAWDYIAKEQDNA